MTTDNEEKKIAKIFIIYAREDEEFRHELQKALTPLEKNNSISIWSDKELIAGEIWENRIKEELKTADLITVLVSNNYFQSKFIHEVEIKEALERHNRNETVLIPIIVRPCVWDVDQTISRLQVLPTNGVPVSNQRYWGTNELAWEDVARGISIALKLLKDKGNPKSRRVVLMQEKFIDDDVDAIVQENNKIEIQAKSHDLNQFSPSDKIGKITKENTEESLAPVTKKAQKRIRLTMFSKLLLILLPIIFIIWISNRYFSDVGAKTKNKPITEQGLLQPNSRYITDSLSTEMQNALNLLDSNNYSAAINKYKEIILRGFIPSTSQVQKIEMAIKNYYDNKTKNGKHLYKCYNFNGGMMRMHISETGKVSFINGFGEKINNDFDSADDFDVERVGYAKVFIQKAENKRTKRKFGNYFFIDKEGKCQIDCN